MAKFNVKTTDKKIISVEGKLVKKPNPPKAPAWFVEFEKRNNEKFDKLGKRIDNLVSKNNLKE